jgi:hypothetical protein
MVTAIKRTAPSTVEEYLDQLNDKINLPCKN